MYQREYEPIIIVPLPFPKIMETYQDNVSPKDLHGIRKERSGEISSACPP